MAYDASGNGSNTATACNWLTTDGTWNYSYDDEGNQTKKVNVSSGLTWTYGYDQSNHLTHVERRTTDGGTLELSADYKYDAWGNRVEKSVDADGAGAGAAVATRFAYDGWNPAKGDALGTSEFDVWADLDGSSSLTTRYVRGDQVDQLFARLTSSDANRWYLVDHQGSVRNILDNGAFSKDALAYDAFGNIVSESNSAERGRYGWTSREIDAETGLQYNRARYYDATTGRWISQDPMGFDAGDSNLYRYARNGTENHTDPSGLQDPRPFVGGDFAPGEAEAAGRLLLDGIKWYNNPRFGGKKGGELDVLTDPNCTFGSAERIIWDGQEVSKKLPAGYGKNQNGTGHLEFQNGKWVLKGRWTALLYASDHNFIAFFDRDALVGKSTVYTFGRYAKGFGTGNNAAFSGVIMNEKKDLARLEPASGFKIGRLLMVDNPVIYGGEGYNVVTNNCSTYSSQVWNRLSSFFPEGWPIYLDYTESGRGSLLIDNPITGPGKSVLYGGANPFSAINNLSGLFAPLPNQRVNIEKMPQKRPDWLENRLGNK